MSVSWPFLVYLLACPSLSWTEIPVDVHVETRSELSDPLSARLFIEPLWSAPDGASLPLPPFAIPITVPTSTRFPLCTELAHEVAIGGSGVWSPERRLLSKGDASPIRFRVSRTGTVRATVVPASPTETDAWPVGLATRFSLRVSPLEVSADQEIPGRCVPISRSDAPPSIHCELPEGVLDLRLQPEGFVPLYAWDLRIDPDRTARLPDLVLRRGASLVGRIETEDGAPAASAEVLMEPAVSDPMARAHLGHRMKALTFRSTTNDRGYFQIVGPPEGVYEVRGALPGYGLSEPVRTPIVEPVEHAIDRIEIPYFPSAVVKVEPATAPGGGPWTVLVIDPSGVRRQAATDAEGRASFDLPRAGRYGVAAEAEDGARWAMRSVVFDARHPEASIRIDEVPVIGAVSFGGEPLSAKLCFGGCLGGESISLHTIDDGTFAGVISRQGDWTLEIQAEDPFVRHVFSKILVELDEGIGAAEVNVDLPATSIEGRVVDTLGQPIEGARLILQPRSTSGRPVQLGTDSEGSFSIHGQPYGRYAIEALYQRRRSSAPRTVEISEAAPEAAVEIVLGDPVEIRGKVVTESGEPVAGATVWPVERPGARGASLTIPAATDADGTFELAVPPRGGSTSVAILANGFVLGIAELSTRGDSGEPPVIRISPTAGGTLHLVARHTPSVHLVYDGRWQLDLALLATWAGRNGTALGHPGQGDLVVPRLPAGNYSLCVVDGDDASPSCRSGYLANGGHLSLETGKETG